MDRVLGLVFTYHLSLKDWVDLGLFDREKQIYEEHLKKGNFDKVIWFTYGVNDREMCDELIMKSRLDSRIEVVAPPKWMKNGIGRVLYTILIPIIHADKCKQLSVIKSNQMGGAKVAAAIAKRYRIPLELRTGYTYSLFGIKRRGENNNWLTRIRNELWISYYKYIERKLYHECDFATVSSIGDKRYVCDEYKIKDEKVHILTNYIDCNKFRIINPLQSRENRFLFVGRLSEQKNLVNLVKAFAKLGKGLDIYGEGDQIEELNRIISETGADVILKGKVLNSSLPAIYNRYKYFVISSYYEGMPKTLLEAMACGCICFGTNVEGINEIIEHGENGYLFAGTNEKDIIEGIREQLEDEDVCRIDIAATARNNIIQRHSLDSVCNQEYVLMQNYLGIES